MNIRTVQVTSDLSAQGELICTFLWGDVECAIVATSDGRHVSGRLVPEMRREELTDMTRLGDTIHDT